MPRRWCFYLQADEVLHERDYPRLSRAMKANLHRQGIEGLSFRYHHFRADYAIRDPLPYRRQVRIVRPKVGVQSFGDACGFQVNGRKLRTRSTGAWIYHYGYVKPPSRMAAKMDYFLSLYDGRKIKPGEELKAEDYEWDLRTCEPFAGRTGSDASEDRGQGLASSSSSVDATLAQPSILERFSHKNTRTFRRWAWRCAAQSIRLRPPPNRKPA